MALDKANDSMAELGDAGAKAVDQDADQQLLNNPVRTLRLLVDEVKRVNNYEVPTNPTQKLKELEEALRLVKTLLERAGLPRRMIPVS